MNPAMPLHSTDCEHYNADNDLSSHACSRNGHSSSASTKSAYQRHPKPPFSYIALIAMAIRDSPKGRLTLAEINEYLMREFPFFRGDYQGWKVLRDPTRPWGKDNYWTLNPNSEYTFADGVFRRRRKRISPCLRMISADGSSYLCDDDGFLGEDEFECDDGAGHHFVTSLDSDDQSLESTPVASFRFAYSKSPSHSQANGSSRKRGRQELSGERSIELTAAKIPSQAAQQSRAALFTIDELLKKNVSNHNRSLSSLEATLKERPSNKVQKLETPTNSAKKGSQTLLAGAAAVASNRGSLSLATDSLVARNMTAPIASFGLPFTPAAGNMQLQAMLNSYRRELYTLNQNALLQSWLAYASKRQ